MLAWQQNTMRKLIATCVLLAACGSSAGTTVTEIDLPDAEVVLPGQPRSLLPPPGSGGGTTAATSATPYLRDDDLRINEIQMKGSHNSYHLASDAPNAPKWTQYSLPSLTDQLMLYGVRQVELDIHYYGGRFLVFHLPDVDQRSNCPEFLNCLRELVAWSKTHPYHHPVFVWLEFKDSWDPEKITPHIEELENTVRGAIPREKLLTPDDVRRGMASVTEGLNTYGWPRLGEARGKFVFVILNEGDGRWAYTYGGKTLNGRAMFVTSRASGYGVVTMIDNVLEQPDAVYGAVNAGYLVRTRVDDLPGQGCCFAQQRDKALEMGAHMITTDYPVPNSVPGYSVDMPGGAPSRCNPVTARDFCTSLLIENPGYLTAP